jgi:8-oxo-dGTP diphosphatase
VRGRERPACDACGFVLYENPVPGVAVVLVEDGKVLLARRRSSLFGGMWCIPCGYVEGDEDVREAARREFREETGLEVEVVEVVEVHSSFQVPGRPVVGIWFWGRAVGGRLRPGDDVRELRFFSLDAVPEDLAFEGDRLVLEKLRRDRRTATDKH